MRTNAATLYGELLNELGTAGQSQVYVSGHEFENMQLLSVHLNMEYW